MWAKVVTVSEGIAIYLAHTEAHHNDDGAAVEQADHRAVELLEPLWRPLFEHLRAGGLLLHPEAWADDRAELIKIGRAGLTEVWERLGIVASPHEDTYHLAVNEPTF